MPSDTLCVVFSETPSDWPEEQLSNPETTNEREESRVLDLSDCLRAFMATDTSEWFCAHCRTQRAAHKTLRVTRAPNHLIISLKRFLFFDNKSHKISEKVRFAPQLDLKPLCDSPLNYRLRAVVLHSGNTVSSGHYSALVWDDNQWLLCNDDAVHCQQPEEDDSRAYILFYSRESG